MLNNMQKHIQYIPLFFFGLFMTSVHTQGLTNVPVELGQDTILNCSLDQSNVVWHTQLLGESSVPILKSFNKNVEDPFYFNQIFKGRYSLKLGNRLLIHNVTVEEMRLYYCTARRNDTTFLKETFHLVSGGNNFSADKLKSQADFTLWSNSLLTFMSLALNCILITVIAGVYLSARCHNNRPIHPDSDPSSGTTESPGNPMPAVYEEIQLSSSEYRSSHHIDAVTVSESQLPRGSDSECIYYKAQIPLPTSTLQ